MITCKRAGRINLVLALICFTFLIGNVSAGELKITGVEIPSEVEADSTFQAVVEIEGINWKGSATLESVSNSMTINPSSKSILVEGVEKVNLIIKAPNKEQINYLILEVCEQNQFEESYCDRKEVSVRTVINKSNSGFFLIGIVILAFLILLSIIFYLIFKKK